MNGVDLSRRINGLDLFSGIGGLAVALAPWVRVSAYCECDPYAQGVLLSRMRDEQIDVAPIWDDVRTLHSRHLPGIDIIYGGFPCQDISQAGLKRGLAGERSGLFFEIARLVGQLRPEFVFLENVPAITIRGGWDVIGAFTALGYDCRWCMLSAASVGANHKRERWFLMAHSPRIGHGEGRETGNVFEENGRPDGSVCFDSSGSSERSAYMAQGNVPADANGKRCNDRRDFGGTRYVQDDINGDNSALQQAGTQCEPIIGEVGTVLADANGQRCQEFDAARIPIEQAKHPRTVIDAWGKEWWIVEPSVDRVVNGVPHRVDRIKCLGNAVVPLQAATAFKILLHGPGAWRDAG